MSDLNKATLICRLGSNPEVNQTGSGKSVVNISAATTANWKGKDGEKQEKTEWHRLVFYSALADIVGNYLKKGSRIFVEGRLQTSKWKDKDGVDRYTTEIVVSEMQMLDAKKAA